MLLACVSPWASDSFPVSFMVEVNLMGGSYFVSGPPASCCVFGSASFSALPAPDEQAASVVASTMVNVNNENFLNDIFMRIPLFSPPVRYIFILQRKRYQFECIPLTSGIFDLPFET